MNKKSQKLCNQIKKNHYNKTLKNKSKKKECIAKLEPDPNIKNNKVNGIVNFLQDKNELIIKYKIYNLKDGKHGFHIHKCGDLRQSCKSACDHFNPYNKCHGDLNSHNSHAGDLGNIISKNGLSKGIIKTKKVSIKPDLKNNIIGRMIIVHENPDDLGKGNDKESLITGNAGARLACGIIGVVNI